MLQSQTQDIITCESNVVAIWDQSMTFWICYIFKVVNRIFLNLFPNNMLVPHNKILRKSDEDDAVHSLDIMP